MASLKRFLSGLLAALMVLTLLPSAAWADTVDSGTCGDNLTYTLDSEGTLTISGTGEMEDYVWYDEAPWYDYKDSVQTAVIQQGVTSIGEYAFYYCSSLSSISIPNSVTSIGNSAFLNCDSLTAIQVASGNSNYSSSAGVLFNKAKTELICYPAGLSGSYTIPNSVTSIGDYAFCDCTGLTGITIPDSVTSIGDSAFANCTSLTSISIPNGVTSIGDYAFDNTAYYNDANNWTDGLLYLGVYLLDAKTDITFAAIRGGTKTIAGDAFAWCDNLTSVSIPNSVISIGSSAFRKCRSLRSISIPGGVTSIGDFTFEDCNSLNSISIPSGVTSIGEYAFSDCISLSSISIPASVTYIGDYAFGFCTKLSSVTLPKGLDTLHAGTFFVCSALKELTVPEGVTTIEEDVFGVYGSTRGCTSLKKVTLPESLTSVEESAFSGALNLEDVYYAGSKSQWNKISIGSDNEPLSEATIHYNWAPAAPKISSSIVTSTGKIKLTWSAVDNAAKYYIYRSTDGGKTYKYYDSTTKTSYTNTSVTPGTKYYYKLKSVSATGEKSAYSNAVYRTADCAKPSLSSSIVTNSGAIKLSWDKVTGAAKYYIYRSTDGGKTYKYYTSTTFTSWTNKSVTPGTKYYYKIKAICSNTEGNSAYSNVVYRTADCAKPSLSSSIVSSSGAIKLSWSKVTGATKYYIYRSTDGGTTYKYYTSTTSTSWTNKSVTPGTKYYYKIKAICSNTEGNSAYSNVVYRTADCAKPVVTIQLNGGKPQLKWSAVTGTTKYYIYRSTDGTSFSFFDSTTKLSYTNTGAKSDTTYYYKVMAICAKSSYGNSAYSSVVSIKSK